MKSIISILFVTLFVAMAFIVTPSCSTSPVLNDSVANTVKNDTVKIDTIKVVDTIVKK